MILKEYDSIDKEILKLLQGNLPIESRPYQELSQKIGISEEEIIIRIKLMLDKGIIRRCGAILRHQKTGYLANAMVAWKVRADNIDAVGIKMAQCLAVSHCYSREMRDEFPYNLFTMIHARNQDELQEIIASLVTENKINDYVVLKTLHEFKKSSMCYF